MTKERSFPVRLSVGEFLFALDGRVMCWTGAEFEQVPGNWKTDPEPVFAEIGRMETEGEL